MDAGIRVFLVGESDEAHIKGIAEHSRQLGKSDDPAGPTAEPPFEHLVFEILERISSGSVQFKRLPDEWPLNSINCFHLSFAGVHVS